MKVAGEDPTRIAAKLRITIEDVEDYIRSFEAARAAASHDIVDMVINSEVLVAANGMGHRLQAAQNAERFTGVYDKQGNPIYEPDHHLALDAIKTMGDMMAQVRPKGSGPAINIGINNAGRDNGSGTGVAKNFEQRVHDKRGILADADVKFLSDGKSGEIVDGDVDEDEDNESMMDGTSELEIEESTTNPFSGASIGRYHAPLCSWRFGRASGWG